MRQYHHGLLVVLALACTVYIAHARFAYAISGGEVTITGYDGPGGDVVIPNMIEGLPVTGIAYNAFVGNTSLTSVTIPDTVIWIGGREELGPHGAFAHCSNLASVTIGSSVTSIEEGAFMSCTSLTIITIPDSVISIGWYAFRDCTSLTSITIR